MKVGIVGYGYVGQGMRKVFPDAVLFDPYNRKATASKEDINDCDLAVVCVPTNELPDGDADLSIIEEVIGWIEADYIHIKSAIPPGTTDRLIEETGKKISVSPEYMGEGNYFTPPWKYPDPKDTLSHGFMVIGGTSENAQPVADAFIARMGPHTRIRIVPAVDAELTKYAENTWGATKVIFAHLLRDVVEATPGATWQNVREGWLDDPRVEPMHTAVFGAQRGFGGKCFPKDLSAFLRHCDKVGVEHKLLKAVKEQNKKYVG